VQHDVGFGDRPAGRGACGANDVVFKKLGFHGQRVTANVSGTRTAGNSR
jgi:hypothetical protein